MVYKNIPISLQKEEDEKNNFRQAIKNLFKRKQNIVEEKENIKTIEDKLQEQFEPYVSSGKYNNNELDIIKKRIFNTLQVEDEELNYMTPPQKQNNLNLPVIPFRPKTETGLNWVKNVNQQEDQNFLEFDQDSLINTSLYSQVIPTIGSETDVDMEFNQQDFDKALGTRKQNENKQSNKLNYIRIYNDSIYNINENKEYIEIDGIRRSVDQENGGYKYEIYNILDFQGEDNIPMVGENLQLASEEQVDSFLTKLWEFEYEANVNSILNDNNLTAGGNADIQASISMDVQNKNNLLKSNTQIVDLYDSSLGLSVGPNNALVLNDNENIADYIIDNSDISDDDRELTKEFLNKILKQNKGGGKTLYELARLPDWDKAAIMKKLREKGINIEYEDLFNTVGKRDLAMVFRLKNGLQIPIYGEEGAEFTIADAEGYEKTQHIASIIDQMKEASSTLLIEAEKKKEEIGKQIMKDFKVWENKFSNKYLSFTYDNKIWFLPNMTNNPDKRKEIEGLFRKEGVEIQLVKGGGPMIDEEGYIIPGQKMQMFYVSEGDWLSFINAKNDNLFENNTEWPEYMNIIDESWKLMQQNFVSNYKPGFELINTETQDFIKQTLFKNPNFDWETQSTLNKKRMTDFVWANIEQAYYDVSPIPSGYDEESFKIRRNIHDTLQNMKKEYYYMMMSTAFGSLGYEDIPNSSATQEDVDNGLADKVGGPLKRWSVYAIKDFARDLLDPESGYSLVDMIKDAKKRKDTSAVKKLNLMHKYLLQITEADEETMRGDDNFFQNLWSGLTKNEPKDWIAFLGSGSNFFDNTHIKDAADKIQNKTKLDVLLNKPNKTAEDLEMIEVYKGLPQPSSEDMLLMNMLTLNNMITEKLTEGGGIGYGIGGIVADMFPYVWEFSATRGFYNKTSKATNLFFKNTLKMTGPVAGRISQVISFLTGSAVHGIASPQIWGNYTLDFMTPSMQMALREHNVKEDSIFDLLDKNSKGLDEYESGKDYIAQNGKAFTYEPIWDGEDIMPLETALLRGLGLAVTEVGTERLGRHFLPLFTKITGGKFKGIGVTAGDKLRGYRELLESIFLSKLSKTNKFKKWYKNWRGDKPSTEKLQNQALRKYIMKNTISWDGLIQEVGEETINQPISSLILGEQWNDAFVDENGDFDPTFFTEVGGAMFITNALFNGGNLYIMNKNIKKPKK